MKFKKIIDLVFTNITYLSSLFGYLFYTSIIFFINSAMSYNLIIMLIISTILIIGIRSIYFRDRPNPMKYLNYLEKLDASSFPSLHSLRAVLIGMSIVNLFATPLSLAFCVLFIFSIALSRYYLKKHHLTDIYAGLLLGFIIFTLLI